MPRLATAALATGALLLGAGVSAVPAAAAAAPAQAPAQASAPAARAVKKGFTTKNGKSKLFKNAEAKGTATVTADKISIKFRVRDKKKDGWTPGVQFAAVEAWDVDDSGVYYPTYKARRNSRGTPTPGGSGSIDGPPIANDVKPSNQPKCYGCYVKRIKKKKPLPQGPADGRYTYKFKKSFSSKYTEAIYAREILVRKKGKKFKYKKGPLTLVYFAPVGPLVGGSSDARAMAAAGAAKLGKADLPGKDEFKKVAPTKAYPYSSRMSPGQLSGITGWGIVTGIKQGGTVDPRVLIRVRDDRKDGRLTASRIFYTNADASQVDGWDYWNPKDVVGRWTTRVGTSYLKDHMFFRTCVGRLAKNAQGQTYFQETACGELLRGY